MGYYDQGVNKFDPKHFKFSFFQVPVNDIHPIFATYCDTILLVDKGQGTRSDYVVSSTYLNRIEQVIQWGLNQVGASTASS